MCLKQKRGRKGEDIACKYLQRNNYTVIDRNFRCRQGEVDIIACDEQEKELVFFEVKTRSNLKYGRPSEAVQKTKQNHIISVAKYYIFLNHSNNKINHIKKAF